MPRVKWSDVKDPAPIKPGWYTVVVQKAQDTTTQKGDEMTKLTYEIIDEGDFKGEKIFDNFVYTEGALPAVKVGLEALGMALTDDMDFEAQDLVGRTMMVNVKMGEYQGQARPEVIFRGYKSTDTEAPEVSIDEAPQEVDEVKF